MTYSKVLVPLIALLYLLLSSNALAQGQLQAEPSSREEPVFTIVENPPKPEGGLRQFYQYIADSLNYPIKAKKEEIEGKVFISFVVDTDGSLTDVTVVKGIGGGCDEEAVRVISKSPKWIHATSRGKPVKVKMVLPITFKSN